MECLKISDDDDPPTGAASQPPPKDQPKGQTPKSVTDSTTMSTSGHRQMSLLSQSSIGSRNNSLSQRLSLGRSYRSNTLDDERLSEAALDISPTDSVFLESDFAKPSTSVQRRESRQRIRAYAGARDNKLSSAGRVSTSSSILSNVSELSLGIGHLHTTDICDRILHMCSRMKTLSLTEGIESLCTSLDKTSISEELAEMPKQLQDICYGIRQMSTYEVHELVDQLCSGLAACSEAENDLDLDSVHCMLHGLSLQTYAEQWECCPTVGLAGLNLGTPNLQTDYDQICQMMLYLLTVDQVDRSTLRHYVQRLCLL